jgi:CRP-like cAMP-binding protein
MANNTNQAGFDPKAFLAIVGEGKTILEFGKDQVVFAQGDAADTVFYIQTGRVKVVSYPSRAKRRWSEFSGPASSLAKAA